jgi:XTP/dITP diphosphohydrolase
MKKIVIATANEHKLEEIIYILKDVSVKLLSLKNFPEIAPIKEDGMSFRENAIIKAETVYNSTKLLSLADDSGLEVDALNGAPGIFSARYASEEKDYLANNHKLLQELKDVPEADRSAQFRCVVAIIGPDIRQTIEGIIKGRIIYEMKGKKGFGYDPLFLPDGYKRTLAELGMDIKNRISHRAIAFQKAKQFLQDMIT